MKVINYAKCGGLEETMNEVEVLKKLNHPCIIQYEVATIITPTFLFIKRQAAY